MTNRELRAEKRSELLRLLVPNALIIAFCLGACVYFAVNGLWGLILLPLALVAITVGYVRLMLGVIRFAYSDTQ